MTNVSVRTFGVTGRGRSAHPSRSHDHPMVGKGTVTSARAGLELLVGPDRYPRHLAKAMSAFALGLIAIAIVAWLLPRPATPAQHFGWILALALVQSPIAVLWWFQGHRWPQ